MGGPRKPRCEEMVKVFSHRGPAFLIARDNSAQDWRIYKSGTPGIVGTLDRRYDARNVESILTGLCSLKYGGVKTVIHESGKPKLENFKWDDLSGCWCWQL